MQLLVTGATGKVGQAFIARFLADPKWASASVLALCHNRTLPETARLKVVRGSIADPDVVKAAVAGTTHVIHMATVKEDPVQAMDVAVKGMFLLVDAFRQSPEARQFILVGGDCGYQLDGVGQSDMLLLRYTAAGSLDKSFGGNGTKISGRFRHSRRPRKPRTGLGSARSRTSWKYFSPPRSRVRMTTGCGATRAARSR